MSHSFLSEIGERESSKEGGDRSVRNISKDLLNFCLWVR